LILQSQRVINQEGSAFHYKADSSPAHTIIDRFLSIWKASDSTDWLEEDYLSCYSSILYSIMAIPLATIQLDYPFMIEPTLQLFSSSVFSLQHFRHRWLIRALPQEKLLPRETSAVQLVSSALASDHFLRLSKVSSRSVSWSSSELCCYSRKDCMIWEVEIISFRLCSLVLNCFFWTCATPSGQFSILASCPTTHSSLACLDFACVDNKPDYKVI
jgi:hypothetical protein